MNFGLSMLWFWTAYIVVTLVGIGHTCFNWKILGMEMQNKPIKTMYDIVPYAKTVPYHPIYNIILWPIFAYIYFVLVAPNNVWDEVFILALTWTGITIIFDLFGWVVIKHPWRMTFKEMYVDYQPWIALIYISIFISPDISAFIYAIK